MTRAHRIALAVFSAGTLAALSSARADTDSHSRAVIRGTGNDVQIVYRAPRSAPGVTIAVVDPVTAALERKTAGETDQAVLTYLSAHRDDLPDVVSADALRRLRKAGAGDEVIAFLSSNAAVDIGATAEDGVAVVQDLSPGTAYGGAYPDLVSSGYPFYGAGGYGGYAGDGGHRGHFGGLGKMGHFNSGFFFGFGNGFGKGFGHNHGFGHGFGPHPLPHPGPMTRGGGTTHAAISGGRHP